MYTQLKSYIKVRLAAEAARSAELHMWANLPALPLPENLRPATAADIVESAVIWYPAWVENNEPGESRPYEIVDEVYDATEDFKGYNGARTNCTYGLHGAFVEVTK